MQRFNCVEINTSFYCSHRRATYERWRQSSPEDFLSSVKIPREVSHDSPLGESSARLQQFLTEISGLGPNLGVLLLQLAPSHEFQRAEAQRFFAVVLSASRVPVVCEPRHATWFAPDARSLLSDYGVGLVNADPPRTTTPLPTGRVYYYRLHGSPRMYYSSYPDEDLAELAKRVAGKRSEANQVWCVFDNTAAHAAWADALRLRSLLRALVRRSWEPRAR